MITLNEVHKGIKEVCNTHFPNHLDSIKSALKRLFCITSHNYDKETIFLRLTAIDSLYSTNSKMAYFALDELAQDILNLGDEHSAANLFSDFIYNTDSSTDSIKMLFKKKYGIHKNLTKGPSKSSLISKYAYYQLLIFPKEYPDGFPIYDTLVCNILPNLEGCNETGNKLKSNVFTFFNCIKKIKEELDITQKHTNGRQTYDAIDSYLWRLGKIESGSLSLITNKSEYSRIIKQLGLNKDKVSTSKNISSKKFDLAVKENFPESIFSDKSMNYLLSQYNEKIKHIWNPK